MNELDREDVAIDVKGEPTRASHDHHDAGESASVPSEERARDLALVELARKGDRQAFGKLVERYQRRVYALAFGILRQREDAWDVAQEAFVKAYRNLDRFEGNAAFYTWLYRITYNLSIDTLREKSRRDAVDLAETKKIEEAMEREGRSGADTPDETAQRKELAGVIEKALSLLSEKHRAIIVLREIEGLSYEEMADVLGISKGTVMSRLFHARQNLQALLLPYVKGGDHVPQSLRLALHGA